MFFVIDTRFVSVYSLHDVSYTHKSLTGFRETNMRSGLNRCARRHKNWVLIAAFIHVRVKVMGQFEIC